MVGFEPSTVSVGTEASSGPGPEMTWHQGVGSGELECWEVGTEARSRGSRVLAEKKLGSLSEEIGQFTE